MEQQVQVMFRQALALHQGGRLDEARAIYDEILRIQPGHFDSLHLRGVLAIQTGQREQGIKLIDEALRINPNAASAYNNRGNALKDLKRLDEALASYDKAILLNPDHADTYYNRGSVLIDLKRLDEALASYDKALTLKPDSEAYNNRGSVLMGLKRLDEALASYDRALTLRPDYVEACNNRGNVLMDLKRLDEALASYDRALSLKPDYAEACNNRGVALQELDRLDEALASYDRALSLRPDYAEAFYNRGNVLKDLNRLDEALASYDRALSHKPDYAEACNNRGNVLKELKRLDEALASYDRALSLRPDYAEACNNRGNVLKELKRLDEALAAYDRALTLRPDYAEACSNRGNVLKDLKRLDEALAAYDRALLLKPDSADACNNRGVTLHYLKRLGEALASYDKALSLKPDNADACYNRGNVLRDLRRPDEALISYAKALALKPDYDCLFGTYLHTRMTVCDWDSFTDNLDKQVKDILESNKVTQPFPLLSLVDSPELHKAAARNYCDTYYPKRDALGPFVRHNAGRRIRLGYYSADFHNHATAYLVAELLEEHDRGRFELYGFSFGPEQKDGMRDRVASAFDRFVDTNGMDDREVARLSRELGIDIAVDLKGYTQDARPGIFAEGCAPIQVNYLGYPGTMGAEYIHYVIADKTVIPAGYQSDFTEKVVYLPHSYQVNDSKRKIAATAYTRQELGLPESAFIFCCFNNNHKILPDTFDCWIRILKAVEGSVLWLFEDNPAAARNLKKEAEARGLDSSRLVFATRMPLEEHLARHRQADLFLDTLPYNAHTTASDALWAGLPVLTCTGRSFASRVAASLLDAMQLTELVTHSQAAYESRAMELALHPEILTELRNRLQVSKASSPLFDGKLFARHLEAAYEAMHARHLAGLAPGVIEVQP